MHDCIDKIDTLDAPTGEKVYGTHPKEKIFI